jgi:hypothetical protein
MKQCGFAAQCSFAAQCAGGAQCGFATQCLNGFAVQYWTLVKLHARGVLRGSAALRAFGTLRGEATLKQNRIAIN